MVSRDGQDRFKRIQMKVYLLISYHPYELGYDQAKVYRDLDLVKLDCLENIDLEEWKESTTYDGKLYWTALGKNGDRYDITEEELL